MIWIILFYILPGILNTILFKDTFDEYRKITSDESSIYYAYAVLCFMPVVNLLTLFYLISVYVYEIFRKD